MNLRLRDFFLPIIALLLLLCASIAHCQTTATTQARGFYKQTAVYFIDGTSYTTTNPAFRISATENSGRITNLVLLNAAVPLTQTWSVGNGNQWNSVDQLVGQVHAGDTILLAPGQTSTTTGFDLPSSVTIRTAGAPRHVLKLVNPHGQYTPTINMGGAGSSIRDVVVAGAASHNLINYSGSSCEIANVELRAPGEYGIAIASGCNGLKLSGLTCAGGLNHTLLYLGNGGGNINILNRNVNLADADLLMDSGQHLIRWYGIKDCTIGSPTKRTKLKYTSGYKGGDINIKQGDGLLIQNLDMDGGGFGLGPLPGENPAYRLKHVVVRNCTIKALFFIELEWGLENAVFEDCTIVTPQTPLTTGVINLPGKFAPTATFTRCRFYSPGKTQVYKGAVHGIYNNCTLNDRPLGADGKVH